MTYVVEKLTAQDYIWAVEVASVKMLTEELKRPDFVNRNELYKLVGRGIDEETILICKKDGEPVGIIGWLYSNNVFNPDLKVAAEVLWYILPEHRNSRAGYMLLKAYSDWAEERNTTALLSLLPGSKVNFKSLEKFGFKQSEFQFTKG